MCSDAGLIRSCLFYAYAIQYRVQYAKAYLLHGDVVCGLPWLLEQIEQIEQIEQTEQTGRELKVGSGPFSF